MTVPPNRKGIALSEASMLNPITRANVLRTSLSSQSLMRRAKSSKPSKPQWPPSVSKEYYESCIQQMPKGAIKADLAKHAPHKSYSPPMWYVDEKQKCVDCGAEFPLTARQQQHWFEVLQIPIHVAANRRPACRRKRRNENAGQKHHMAEMKKRPHHPNEESFRKRAK